MKKGDAVFIVSAIAEQNYKNDGYINSLDEGLKEFSKALSKRSIKLLFLDAIPLNFKDRNNKECSVINATNNWFNALSICNPAYKSKKTFLKEREKLTKTLKNLEDKNFLVSVDLIDVFCPGELCTFWDKEGIPVYRDRSHPSVYGARLSSKTIKESLNKINNRN